MAKTKIEYDTLEEYEDRFIGPKGTPEREKYEKAVERYRKKVIKTKRVWPRSTSPATTTVEKEVDYDV
jgi:hypothetical protein